MSNIIEFWFPFIMIVGHLFQCNSQMSSKNVFDHAVFLFKNMIEIRAFGKSGINVDSRETNDSGKQFGLNCEIE